MRCDVGTSWKGGMWRLRERTKGESWAWGVHFRSGELGKDWIPELECQGVAAEDAELVGFCGGWCQGRSLPLGWEGEAGGTCRREPKGGGEGRDKNLGLGRLQSCIAD